jgi:inositol 1,4,5-triphosphate receptor type 1/inositol 1,4,5-triphosphate receptor type 3
METKILNILTRFYNQRLEFAQLTTNLLLLFDDTNINIFLQLKKKARMLAKNVDESETWMQDMETKR